MPLAAGPLGRLIPKSRMGRRLALLMVGLSAVLLVAVLLMTQGHSECLPVDDDVRRSANPVEVLAPEQSVDTCVQPVPGPDVVPQDSARGTWLTGGSEGEAA